VVDTGYSYMSVDFCTVVVVVGMEAVTVAVHTAAGFLNN